MAELLWDRKLSVGAPFFNAAFSPFMVALVILLPLGAIMPWKRAQIGRGMRPLWPILLVAIAFGGLLWAMQTGTIRAWARSGQRLALWVVLGAAMDLWMRTGRGGFSDRLGRV